MEQREKEKLNRKVTVRFTEQEYLKIFRSYKSTTHQKLSGYIRSVLLHKPVTVYTRNQSFDDFVAEMILLRRELHAIGNNFNQAVKKLNAIDNNAEIKVWAKLNEINSQMLYKKTEEINLKILNMYRKWSQE